MENYKQLEKEYAQFTGALHGVSCNSGTSALHLALLAIGVKEDNEVICPDFTMAACGFAISYTGATPIFVDCDESFNIDTRLIEAKITKKTKAIMAVHIYGRLCNMSEILRIANKHGLYVIEDACFPAGTQVLTSNGNKNIENIKVGDLILTRKGYKKVLVSSMTGIKKVITHFGMTATSDHPYITTKGVKRLDALCASDTLYKWNEKLSRIEEKSIIDIQSQIDDKPESITGNTTHINPLFHCIDKFGLITLVKSVKDWLYTIKMKTHSIIKFPILNYSRTPLTVSYTPKTQKGLEQQQKICQNMLGQKQSNGIKVIGAKNSEERQQKFFGKQSQLSQKNAKYAKKNIEVIFQTNQGFVLENVKTNQDTVPVFNLTVEDCHEFFADNILVHNCEAQGAVFGSKADITCYSFYKNKIIHAEEGGMCTTNNIRFADKMNCLKNMAFGEKHDYYHAEIGYNYRMSDTMAGMALQSLRDYPQESERRLQFEKEWDKVIPTTKRDAVWVYDFLCKNEDERNCNMKDMKKKGLQVRYFFKPLSSMPMWREQEVGKKALEFSKRGMYICI